MADDFITTFRATSGSQVIYFDSTETPPPGITNRVVVSRHFNLDVVSGSAGSRVLWKWNGQDTSQFNLEPVQRQNLSASLNVISSSFSPTSKSLQILGDNVAASLGDHIVFLTNTTLETTNYIIEIGIRDVGPGPGGSGGAQGGPVFLAFGSGSSFHGVASWAHSDNNNLTLELWQTGSIDETNANVAGGSTEPVFFQIEVRGNKPSANSFRFSAQVTSHGDNNEGAHLIQDNEWNPLISTWGTSSINRFGLGLRGNSSSTINELIVDHFLVRSHPYLL